MQGRVADDLVGRVFGKWTVFVRANNNPKYKNAMWACRCACDKWRIVSAQSLLNGTSKSCGCDRGLRDYESIYNTLLRNERHPVELTYDEFIEFTNETTCHYCGAPIYWTKKNAPGNGQRYNLDRKDNAVGYTKDNCVVCCTRCNVGKGRFFTYEQWKELGAVIRTWGDGEWASRNCRSRRSASSFNAAIEARK